MLISILIPTYNRPKFLVQAIESCLDHEEDNIEIIIGDDSDIKNIKLIENIELPINYRVFYNHHFPALKQNKNVDSLIQRANGDYSLILHDDDYLLPKGLSKLIEKLKENKRDPCIFFGKQVLINSLGSKLESSSLNFDYLRTEDNNGLQVNPLYKVLRQQVPSNCFLFPSEIGKELGYREFITVGDACDFDFALRLVLHGKCDVYFINKNISTYRISEFSVSRNQSNAIYYKYAILKELNISKNFLSYYKEILHKDINVLCGYYINHKLKKELRSIYYSNYYPFLNRYTIRGFYHFIQTI